MAYDNAPSDEVFNEIKQASISIWRGYDDTHGYASEKIAQIESLTNYRDNWGTMVGMFDHNNQVKLITKLSPKAVKKVSEWL